MPSVPIRDTVATPRAVRDFLGSRHESVAREMAKEARKKGRKNWDEATALAALGLALRELDAEETVNGADVFVAPGNPLASLLQSYLAERAATRGSVRALAGGGKEIVMEEDDGDDTDVAGW